MESPRNPWQLEARRIHDELDGDYEACRRIVAIRWLSSGDTRPVQELLQRAEPLGKELSLLLAVMMDPDWHKIPADKLRFELKAVRRDGRAGRPEDLERANFKQELADRVKAYMDAGIAYDGAIATVCEEFPEAGFKPESIRKAYNERHGRQARARNSEK